MAGDIKQVVARLPLLGPAARAAARLYRKATFPGTVDYWRTRYAGGGNSGRGSYGPFAEFKAEVVNALVAEMAVRSVVEFGCGDGAQLGLARYPAYIGLDVSPDAIRLCRQRFTGDRTKSFFLYHPHCFVDHAGIFRAELGLSLDVLYHLIEDEIYDAYLSHLFGSARRLVVLYARDEDRPSPAAHIRYRRFSDWIRARAPEWRLLRHVPNKFPFTGDDRTGSPSDFYVYRRDDAR